jgi:4-diphosphocytidyl-2-C-methyl-D-erythritol kinase
MTAVFSRTPLRRLLDVPAPAKLNLFLHITGRRPDGYHLLQSVFMLVDWCDTLHFELRADGLITREDLTPGDLPAEDLCVRAARALQMATACTLGVHIGLHKRLLAEAGMGGGSSDAATCLLALNRLWGLGLSRPALCDIGLQLGADVPFFIGGHNAWVEGVGEQLTPVRLPAQRFVIVKPPGGASTQRIFTAPELKRDTKPAIIEDFAAYESIDRSAGEWSIADTRQLLDATRNDLQPVAQALCPEVGDCMAWLKGQDLPGRMTGSGTAVFAPLGESTVLSGAPDSWRVHVCNNMDAHPLSDWSKLAPDSG